MNGDDVVRLAWAFGAIVLVASGLAARRLPIATTLRYAAAWVAIFAGVFVLFLFRDEGAQVWNRAKLQLGGARTTISGSTLTVPMSGDGHFWVDVMVNGREARFLVDSGATTTMLSTELAETAKIDVDANFPVPVETANGTISASVARVERLEVGPIVQHDAHALVAPQAASLNVLGMSFLSSLKSWRVEAGKLILTPV